MVSAADWQAWWPEFDSSQSQNFFRWDQKSRLILCFSFSIKWNFFSIKNFYQTNYIQKFPGSGLRVLPSWLDGCYKILVVARTTLNPAAGPSIELLLIGLSNGHHPLSCSHRSDCSCFFPPSYFSLLFLYFLLLLLLLLLLSLSLRCLGLFIRFFWTNSIGWRHLVYSVYIRGVGFFFFVPLFSKLEYQRGPLWLWPSFLRCLFHARR